MLVTVTASIASDVLFMQLLRIYVPRWITINDRFYLINGVNQKLKHSKYAQTTVIGHHFGKQSTESTYTRKISISKEITISGDRTAHFNKSFSRDHVFISTFIKIMVS